MPTAPLRTCTCGRPTRAAKCERCATTYGNTTQRGYGADWQRTRARYLQLFPLCEDCQQKNKVTIAKEVHHIQKIRRRPDLRLDERNLMSLCEECHDARSAGGE